MDKINPAWVYSPWICMDGFKRNRNGEAVALREYRKQYSFEERMNHAVCMRTPKGLKKNGRVA